MQSPKVACYCRVSTENQIENYSIDEQKERLEAFCKAKGWSKPEMFIDAGFSGGTLNRPALQRLIENVKRGKFGAVAVYKLDRLSRSQKDTLYLIEDVFNAHNVSLVSVCENFDTGTPFGKAMIGILSVFAQLEKEQITERFTMGRIGRAKNGLFHGGGNAPTGYNYVNGHLVVNEFEAVQVREMFERFLNGESIRAIQRSINAKYGGNSAHTRVYNILKNSVYIGKVKFGGIEYNGEHAPIVPLEQFNEVQRLLSEHKSGNTCKTPFRANFLLSGLVICGNCGARYHGNHGYYKCYSRAKSDRKYIIDPDCKNPNLKISELDKFVKAEISRIAVNPTAVEDCFSAESAQAADKQALESRLAEISEQQNRLIELYRSVGIPINSVSEQLRDLENERARLESLIVGLPTEDSCSANMPNNSDILGKLLESADVVTARTFTSLLIERITIMPSGDVHISWRI